MKGMLCPHCMKPTQVILFTDKGRRCRACKDDDSKAPDTDDQLTMDSLARELHAELYKQSGRSEEEMKAAWEAETGEPWDMHQRRN